VSLGKAPKILNRTLLRVNSLIVITRSSATAEIARYAWNGHSRSPQVIRCSANRRSIYDFLLALNSNLTVLQPFLRYHA